MPFFETRGIRIHYQFEFTPDRPILVFSNSLDTDFSMWDAQVDAFRDSFSVLPFDTRGHSDSSIPVTAYTRTSIVLLHTDPHGYALACAAICDTNLRDLIANIVTPRFVVYGDEDPVTTLIDTRFLLDHISSAESLCLPAAHLCNIEAAAVFTDGVLRFLKQTNGRRHHG